jgi:DNA transformation protein and related proteins
MRTDSFAAFVQDELGTLPGVRFRRMFGGHGVYLGEVFFGILFENRIYFKTNGTSRAKYVAAGMPVFRPNARQTLKNYFEVPAGVLEDRTRLLEWAREAAAHAS